MRNLRPDDYSVMQPGGSFVAGFFLGGITNDEKYSECWRK